MSSATEIATLKRLAAGIIRAQGNRFVKELLHRKKIRVGANKDDFERNLTEAIESGTLTREDVEAWLGEVEGWGNQHVYLFNITKALNGDLTRPKIQRRVRAAGLDALWGASTVMTFPDEPQLTSVTFADSVLRLVWQEASPDWAPEPEKNYTVREGLEEYGIVDEPRRARQRPGGHLHRLAESRSEKRTDEQDAESFGESAEIAAAVRRWLRGVRDRRRQGVLAGASHSGSAQRGAHAAIESLP
jgi:hypothetical protein